MKVLNLYFSSTGKTKNVVDLIADVAASGGHQVDTIRATVNADFDLWQYDLVFVGSGVYEWLPGKSLRTLFGKMRQRYVAQGEIKPGAPPRPGKSAVVYYTYGGGHTGVNEAVPTVKNLEQLLEHLGFQVLAEWYLVGQYHGKPKQFNATGRLGDISGRPNEEDLRQVAEMVKGVIQTKKG